jgi:hypothetical protein
LVLLVNDERVCDMYGPELDLAAMKDHPIPVRWLLR